MKVWQCLALVGLSLGMTVAEAQEQDASQQSQQEQNASGESQQERTDDEPSRQDSSAGEQGGDSAEEQGGDADEQDGDSADEQDGDSAEEQDGDSAEEQGGDAGESGGDAADRQADREITPEALFERVVARAEKLAGSAYSAPQSPLPDKLKNLSYNDYRNIRYRSEYALWRDDRLFEVQFFHPGFLYDDPVEMYVLKGGRVDEVKFDPAMFNYENSAAPLKELVAGIDSDKMGFAGFRLHFPINTPDYKDEIAVFLGASYFRLVGRGQSYGASARGLAVDTATQGGEEFPAFRAFWLVRPEPNDDEMTLFALLDSPSVTGAYRFDVRAGNNTIVDVDARLFARKNVGKLGIAPLTSMFLHGENSLRDFDDFRPEVHDSDGVQMHTSGNQWLWRPLSNPPSLNVTQLRDKSPRGFGLMQRDRDFEHYLDLEADYQNRPSLWVRPAEGDWGEGGVELVEIPTDKEIHDNIVAYWVPDAEFQAGDQRRYQYRLSTYGEAVPENILGRVVRVRNGWGADPDQEDPPPRDLRQFIVDFSGGEELSSLAASQPVEANLSVSQGEISELKVRQLPDGETWRASFKLATQGENADMQLELQLRGRRLTETWSYLWNPDVL